MLPYGIGKDIRVERCYTHVEGVLKPLSVTFPIDNDTNASEEESVYDVVCTDFNEA